MTNSEIKQILKELSDKEYKNFSAALIPGCNNMMGVRIPKLRELAKKIANENYKEYLQNATDDYFEEVMLQGLVIGYIRTDIEEILMYISKFVPKINNWSLNDSFCNTLKIVKKNKKIVWNFLEQYMKSDNEYELRFVAIMLMNYYVDDEYVDKSIDYLENVQHNGYYLKMGVAWALATIFIKYPEKIYTVLNNGKLDDFTYNKTIQKMIESYRISENDKNILKKMKRK